MKNYIRPNLEYIVLTVEERFAAGSSGTNCTVYGTCPSGTTQFSDPSGIIHIVNYYPSVP